MAVSQRASRESRMRHDGENERSSHFGTGDKSLRRMASLLGQRQHKPKQFLLTSVAAGKLSVG
jgi:hypothetical protein